MTDAEQLLARVCTDAVNERGGSVELGIEALLDTLAIGIAGMREPAPVAALKVLTPSADGEGVPTWGGPRQYSPIDVALVHGAACHSLDWDDYMHPMHGHCSAVLLSALWGLAERDGRSGHELVEAFLVGYQVDYLLGLVLSHGHYRRGWHATGTIGTLGAAAAASRLLGLSTDGCAAALGIAASSASGLQVNFGTPTKSLHAGFAASRGVLAALLAEQGVGSSQVWLTGEYGMLAVLGGDTTVDAAVTQLEALVQRDHGITSRWGLVQKPYACCGCSHAMVDAVVELTDGLSAADIDEMEVHVAPAVTQTMRETEPTDPFSARYSISWVAAVAAFDGVVGPEQFAARSTSRPEVRSLRERVVVLSDLETDEDDRFAAHVVLRQGGTVRERTVRHARGHPERPLTPRMRNEKQLLALAGIAHEPESLIAVLTTLSTVGDVRSIGDAIRGAVASHRVV